MFLQVEPKHCLTSQLWLSNTGFFFSLCGCVRPASAPAVRCKASLNVKAFWSSLRRPASALVAENGKMLREREGREGDRYCGGNRGVDREQRKTARAGEDRRHDRELWDMGETAKGRCEGSERGAAKPKSDNRCCRCVIDWVAFTCQGPCICKLLICSCCQAACELCCLSTGTHHTVRLNSPRVTCGKTNSCHVRHRCRSTVCFFSALPGATGPLAVWKRSGI